jgi:WD40 repeat protein
LPRARLINRVESGMCAQRHDKVSPVSLARTTLILIPSVGTGRHRTCSSAGTITEKLRSGICGTSRNHSKLLSFGKTLRNASAHPRPELAKFTNHKGPITSIEWHSTDDCVFAASSDDSQVTLWDLAVEHDDDDALPSSNVPSLPPQLLFQHYQECAKELHWHPQMPGMILSVGVSGLDIFKTIAT